MGCARKVIRQGLEPRPQASYSVLSRADALQSPATNHFTLMLCFHYISKTS